MKTDITIPDSLELTRLDRALAELLPDLSRSRIKQLIEGGEVRVGGKVQDTASHKVRRGDVVSLSVPEAAAAEPAAQNIPLEVVFEDKDLLVINKPAGLVVHPAAGHAEGTLVNALLHHCADSLSGIGGVKRPGIVHRLDKDTSGLMLVAKNDMAHAGLAAQLADRTMSRTYQAVVWGVPSPIKGRIDAPLARNPNNRFYMQVRPEGREAATNYFVLEKFGAHASLVECKLESGRTHQIRVHMAHIKHAVVGDPLYGIPATAVESTLKKAGLEGEGAGYIKAFPRQALHAVALQFEHPRTGKLKEFKVDLPSDIKDLINYIKLP
ncbi:MAG: RluA family pseudouridine synthase [Alphaproteobacteria bacterium]|nr:RluA family pseudouridine synthase [Alphaproteobacteria bacterium]